MDSRYRAASERMQGPLAPIMTPFDARDALDERSLAASVEWMAERGVPVLWTTAGTSEMASLTEAEIFDLARIVTQASRGRIFTIVSTGPTWPASKCVEFVRFAQSCGADAAKLHIPWAGRPSDAGVLEFYGRIADATDLPLLAYTLGQPGLSVDLLLRIIDRHPQFVGIKNDTDDQYLHSVYLAAVPSGFRVITGGMQRPFLTGYRFGQRCYTDVFTRFKPQVATQLYDLVRSDRVDEAVAHIRRYEMRLSDLWIYGGRGGFDTKATGKTISWLVGQFATNRVRFPLQTQAPDGPQVAAIRKLLEEFEVEVVR